MNRKRTLFLACLAVSRIFCAAQSDKYTQNYPQNYFRHPLNIPMELVANFGEIRNNHWHMGLDIRTQQRVNLPVYAAADGYIAKVSIEPGGFGQAIYINHPNGLTTLYAHLNAFAPMLAEYVRAQQYKLQRWEADIDIPAGLFTVKQGDYIALSGSTGASQGPHVHFEIRETATQKCLNPLLFGFPIPDAVPPTVTRLALYDRGRSTYLQSPQLFALRKTGASYTPATVVRTGARRVSFAISATDRFTNSANPNGIYAASTWLDNRLQSEFFLDRISYKETRYINAQVDYRLKTAGGATVQHLCPMPGDTSEVYLENTPYGIIDLPDEEPHQVRVAVKDAAGNVSTIEFTLQYAPALARPYENTALYQLVPRQVNVFETERFELSTSEYTVYDTVNVTYNLKELPAPGAVSPLHTFIGASIPTHDSVRVRLLPSVDISGEDRNRVVIKSTSGSRTVVEKAQWQGPWLAAKFRQFGTFQAFIDNQPPSVNAPLPDLSRATRLVFTPTDNFHTIKSFRAEIDGQWLLCSNDKGRSWIYRFDEHFPAGTHELKVTIEDEAGNVTTKSWTVRR
ncbi:M23 family metallopeptidase [Paraflavisolibacter sp. H34]|uniref:M23 family metallopeptidase n=1 Tax=Huijunlia imazamoxiresistens TaxID=3127457 RepID=UPI00301789B6